MRAREIYKYIQQTPGNMNPAILKQMLNAYVERQTNELYDYTVDADIDTDVDLLGKTITDFQKDVKIVDGIVYGTIYYVDGFTGFSGLEEEQSGYYIVLHFESDNADTIKVNGVTLDPDGIHILRFKDITRIGKTTVELIDGNDIAIDTLEFGGLKFEQKKVEETTTEEASAI